MTDLLCIRIGYGWKEKEKKEGEKNYQICARHPRITHLSVSLLFKIVYIFGIVTSRRLKLLRC